MLLRQVWSQTTTECEPIVAGRKMWGGLQIDHMWNLHSGMLPVSKVANYLELKIRFHVEPPYRTL